jgi:hypothetical protein
VEGGQTAITDAVYLSAEHVSEYKKGDESDRRRRALIVLQTAKIARVFIGRSSCSPDYAKTTYRSLLLDL